MTILEQPDTILSYQTDASNVFGRVRAVALAESISDVQDCVHDCVRTGTALSISGNGTGLVGGRVAQSGITLSLERMQQCSINTAALSARVQSGMSMRDFQAAVSAENLLYPPDPTEWSAAMGGTFATNASGARSFKYGSTRKYVQSLRVVLADGEIVDLTRGQSVARKGKLRLTSTTGREYIVPVPSYTMPSTTKHAAGYFAHHSMDAVDLFVGSEGTLGVIVDADVQLLAAPERVLGIIIFFESYESVLTAAEKLRASRGSGGPVSPRLVEFFDRHALDFIATSYPSIPPEAVASLWMEQEYGESQEQEVFEQWTTFIDSSTRLADQTWYAYDHRRHADFRAFRHALPSAVYEKISTNNQSKIGTDIAVPAQHFREFFQFYQQVFSDNHVDYVLFGHIGDCHLHANIFTSEHLSFEQSIAIYDQCIAKGLELEGTVSAEHGIGKLKRKYLRRMFGDEAIREMQSVKRALDPEGILSRGNMFETS